MKFNKLLIMSALMLTLSSNAVSAQDANKFEVKTVAVVDVKRIVDESKAAKEASREVSELKERYMKEIKAQDDKLKDRQKELADQQKALSKEAFAKKVAEFRNKIMAERQEAVRKQRILEAAFMKSLELIRDETLVVVEQIAKEKSIDMVIPTSQLLYNKKGLDISDEVLSRLNKRLTKVEINIKKN